MGNPRGILIIFIAIRGREEFGLDFDKKRIAHSFGRNRQIRSEMAQDLLQKLVLRRFE